MDALPLVYYKLTLVIISPRLTGELKMPTNVDILTFMSKINDWL